MTQFFNEKKYLSKYTYSYIEKGCNVLRYRNFETKLALYILYRLPGRIYQVEKLFCNVIRRERESALIKIRKQCSTWKLDEPVIAGTRSGIISRYSREC